MSKTESRPHHKRRLRNFLLDVGLQLRYTVFIIAVAVFLTAILGSRIYVATQETTRIVTMTASVDPGTEREICSSNSRRRTGWSCGPLPDSAWFWCSA